MRRLEAVLAILVAGGIAWLLFGGSPDTDVSVDPAPASPVPSPPPMPSRPVLDVAPTPLSVAPQPSDAPSADADEALVGTLEALLTAADDCAFEQFGDVVDLDLVDPALPVRAMLQHGTHPSDAPYVRDAMEHAASSLQELLETEGCWP